MHPMKKKCEMITIKCLLNSHKVIDVDCCGEARTDPGKKTSHVNVRVKFRDNDDRR